MNNEFCFYTVFYKRKLSITAANKASGEEPPDTQSKLCRCYTSVKTQVPTTGDENNE